MIDNDADYVHPVEMLEEREHNMPLARRLREAHGLVDELRDIATASLMENLIDETKRRSWFLFESGRNGGQRSASSLKSGEIERATAMRTSPA